MILLDYGISLLQPPKQPMKCLHRCLLSRIHFYKISGIKIYSAYLELPKQFFLFKKPDFWDSNAPCQYHFKEEFISKTCKSTYNPYVDLHVLLMNSSLHKEVNVLYCGIRLFFLFPHVILVFT